MVERTRVPFHITDDLELRYALNLDKAGHFISSYFVSEIFSDVLQVTGLPKNNQFGEVPHCQLLILL
jgi:hypothetical protein